MNFGGPEAFPRISKLNLASHHGSFLRLLRLGLLDLYGAFSLRVVRLESIDQSHGDVDSQRIRVPAQLSFVPFGNDAHHAGGLLNHWQVARNLGENIIDRSGREALVVQRSLPLPSLRL